MNEEVKSEESGSEEKKPRKEKSPSAPVFYYAIVQLVGNQSEGEIKTQEIVADKKTELFQKLEALGECHVLFLYRGRKINLQKKTAYKI